MFVKIFIWSIILIFANASVPNFSQHIAQRVFEKGEAYLILVSSSTDEQILEGFDNYCHGRSNCTILSSANSLYQHITSFIGYQGSNYVLIIDSRKHLKYIHQLSRKIDATALLKFQAQFEEEILSPFFASQQPQQSGYDEVCAKLVGTTYQTFLGEDEPVKIVYLYTKSSFCQTCENFFQKFKKIASKYFQRNVIRFGYIDVLKNDNRFIKDQIMPYFLIYIRDNFDDPYGVGADQFGQMEDYIKRLIQDVKGSEYRAHTHDEDL